MVRDSIRIAVAEHSSKYKKSDSLQREPLF